MNIAIIDDEKLWRNMAHKLVQNHYAGVDINIEEFESGDSFLERKGNFDFVLVDIEMPGKDGFETIKEYKGIKQEFITIIFTTHMEISNKGYFVDAFRYINKDNMEAELKEVLTSADVRLETNKTLSFNELGKGNINIRICDIFYIETEARKLIVHTFNGELKCSGKISQYEEELENVGFFRSHKCYLVNMDKVKRFSSSEAEFTDGTTAYVSSRRYAEMKRKYLERKRNISCK